MIDFFTKQEKIFICFLTAGILVGAGIELYKFHFKTVPAISQQEKKAGFEQLLHQRASLIDSLLSERDPSVDSENFSEHQKNLTILDSEKRLRRTIVPIDINYASCDELIQLPQIGRIIANRIIEYRTVHGGFKDIDELINIKGIGEKKFKAIKPYIYIKEKGTQN